MRLLIRLKPEVARATTAHACCPAVVRSSRTHALSRGGGAGGAQATPGDLAREIVWELYRGFAAIMRARFSLAAVCAFAVLAQLSTWAEAHGAIAASDIGGIVAVGWQMRHSNTTFTVTSRLPA